MKTHGYSILTLTCGTAASSESAFGLDERLHVL